MSSPSEIVTVPACLVEMLWNSVRPWPHGTSSSSVATCHRLCHRGSSPTKHQNEGFAAIDWQVTWLGRIIQQAGGSWTVSRGSTRKPQKSTRGATESMQKNLPPCTIYRIVAFIGSHSPGGQGSRQSNGFAHEHFLFRSCSAGAVSSSIPGSAFCT